MDRFPSDAAALVMPCRAVYTAGCSAVHTDREADTTDVDEFTGANKRSRVAEQRDRRVRLDGYRIQIAGLAAAVGNSRTY